MRNMYCALDGMTLERSLKCMSCLEVGVLWVGFVPARILHQSQIKVDFLPLVTTNA